MGANSSRLSLTRVSFCRYASGMEDLLIGYGYPALFVVSFLAATLLPMGSEWLLATLLVRGFDPVLSIGLATFGNTLGGLTSYAIGLWGGPLLIRRVLRMDDCHRLRAEG
ncbi:MAG: hypothetical protein Q8J76_12975, partial [Desulfobulbaceae bacterium]|nr:hypothetical protein [Desulfobulbaceae bacterium]